MKLLKGFNFKTFFLDHGEKVGFGLVVLMTLLVLGGTSWSRYAKTPEEIIVKVTEARNKLPTYAWTGQAEFALQDFMQRTQEVRGPLAISKYEFSTPLWKPLYRKQSLAKEPELVAVLDLIASPGVFALGIAPQTPAGGELLADGTLSESSVDGVRPAAPGAAVAATEGDDEFAVAQRPTGGINAGGAGALSGTLGGTMAAGAHGGAGAGVRPPGPAGGHGAGGPGAGHGGGALSPADAMLTVDYSMMGMMGGEGMMSGPSNLESRGERFIAVRGIWPLQEQLDKLQKALALDSRLEARAYLELNDFTLERQTAVAGSDPWSGPWESVDISRANEVLQEVFDYDVDPVAPEVTDGVITMPLPGRLVGRWGDFATHPKIKSFELSGPELEREQRLQEKLQEQFERMKLQDEARNKPKGGFSKNSRNIRGMAEAIYSSSETSSMFESEMQNMMRTDSVMGAMRPMSLPDLKARLKNPADRLLLFRYFDFDVRPGVAYRYRVKLQLKNPNFERPVEQVEVPSVAQGDFRETPWSKESNVAVVPDSVNYFLKDVERDPVNDPKNAGKPLASFSFFEWDATVGTMIADTVQVKSLGQFLGEKKKSLHLNVAKPYFKDEEVTFRADDLFLDGEGDLKVALEDHKDLKLPSQKKGFLGLLAAAVVVDRSGEVVTLDPLSQTEKEKQLRQRVERERANYEKIKNQEAKPANALSGGDMAGAEYDPYSSLLSGGEGGGQPSGKGKKKSRKPNAMGMGTGLVQ